MKLEVFTKKQGKESTISCIVLRYLTIKLSKALLEQMGSPVWVEFAIDTEEKFIGIRKCDESNPNKFKVSPSSVICCSYFSREIRKLIENMKDNFTFPCDGEQDGYFIFDLSKGENRNGK